MLEINQILKIINHARHEKKMSTKEVASYLNMSQQNYNKIESGKVRLTLEAFCDICSLLDINPEVIIGTTKNTLTFTNEQLNQIQDSLNLLQSEIQKAKTTKGN